jgi:predicted nucleotidyltransferase
MENNSQIELQERFQEAADSFVAKVKADPNVVAVIICGSLAYDKVWEKSDIDMTLIVRDQTLTSNSYCIIEDDITINVNIMIRSSFKRYLENADAGWFTHSYYSKAKILYTIDDALIEYLEDYKKMGRDDIEESALFYACELVSFHEKCIKWLKVKKNPLYAQYYLLKAAEAISRIEVYLEGESPNREAILRAVELNPALMQPFYQDAMSHYYSEEEVEQASGMIMKYLESHLDIIKKPVLSYMQDQEVKTVTMITKYFHTESHFIIGIFDYLADMGVIAKVSQPIRITPKSKLAVEEIAYVYVQ